jgi:hypothetical protein
MGKLSFTRRRDRITKRLRAKGNTLTMLGPGGQTFKATKFTADKSLETTTPPDNREDEKKPLVLIVEASAWGVLTPSDRFTYAPLVEGIPSLNREYQARTVDPEAAGDVVLCVIVVADEPD